MTRGTRTTTGRSQKYGLPHWLNGKEASCNKGDMGSIPRFRSHGGGNGNTLQ